MEILWLVVGVVIGAVLAWWYVSSRANARLEQRESELLQENRRFEEIAEEEREAREKTKVRVSEMEARQTQSEDRIAGLTADLKSADEKLAAERKEHETTRQSLSKTEADRTATAERSGALNAELDGLRTQFEEAKAAAAESAGKLGDAQSANAELETRLNDEKAAREKLQAQLDEIESSPPGVDPARISALEDDVRRRDEEIRRLRGELGAGESQPENRSNGTISDRLAGVVATEEEQAEPTDTTEPATAAPSDAMFASSDGVDDDLTKIKGIGKVLKGKLNKLGITSFRQIAEFTEADIERVNQVLNFPGRIEREKWVDQARELVNP